MDNELMLAPPNPVRLLTWKPSSRWIVSLLLAEKLCPSTSCLTAMMAWEHLFLFPWYGYINTSILVRYITACVYQMQHTQLCMLNIYLKSSHLRYTLGFRARIHRTERNVPTLWQRKKRIHERWEIWDKRQNDFSAFPLQNITVEEAGSFMSVS